MVDIFSLALTHALMALAAWRLLLRDDLDRDAAPLSHEPPPPSRGGRRTMHWPAGTSDDA